jgi:adenylate cyclase
MSELASSPGRSDTSSLEQWQRRARLASGLVLMSFVLTHFSNHILALISLETAEAGRHWFMALWRNPVGTFLFYGALFAHISLALLALYRRRTLVMPLREAVQVAVGLAIPVLIIQHVLGTRVFYSLSGVDDTYAQVANSLWVVSPFSGGRQAIAVVAVWVHGCLGVFFWLRYRRWFVRAGAPLLVFATLFPVLTLLAFVNAGRTVESAGYSIPGDVAPALLAQATETRDRLGLILFGIYGSALGSVLLLRVVRAQRERRHVVSMRYPDGRRVMVPKGYSVLEASRLGGIPHHAVCGGRGRCSTCRVRVLDHLAQLPPADPAEQATLSRIHADPDVRLACQLRPTTDVKIVPLLAVERHEGAGALAATTPGREQDIAVLFCDIRSFTALSDRKLPFDTVFLLNRYFAVVGRAVERAGGRLDKFIGDGAMAIFGLDTPKAEACRQAVSAAAGIVQDLAKVSQELAAELREPLRIAIGVHAGPAIVGTMGYGRVMGVTAIGDTVNIASRLESIAKELDAALVVSDSVASLSGLDLSEYEIRTVDIRGRSKPLAVRVVPQGAALPAERRAVA